MCVAPCNDEKMRRRSLPTLALLLMIVAILRGQSMNHLLTSLASSCTGQSGIVLLDLRGIDKARTYRVRAFTLMRLDSQSSVVVRASDNMLQRLMFQSRATSPC